jgi:hypothetical protein
VNAHYPAVAGRAGHRCEYCRAPEAIFNLAFEVEHVVPVARGGADDESNLALACRACNLYKSDRVMGLDEESGEEVRLCHPRVDRWDEHFRVNAETGEILGTTPIGRATVGRLQMNRPVPLAARRAWMILGLFP